MEVPPVRGTDKYLYSSHRSDSRNGDTKCDVQVGLSSGTPSGCVSPFTQRKIVKPNNKGG